MGDGLRLHGRLGVGLLGFVFYRWIVNHSSLTEYSGMSTSGIVFFVLVIYSLLMWTAKTLMAKNSVEEVRTTLIWGGAVASAIIFAGMTVMLYVQNLVRQTH